jgi:hypothetical protein
MGLGWRGVMTRYSGFYDLPTAWSMMFWGILIGGLYGALADYFMFIPYISSKMEDASISNLIVICLLLAVGVHLMLRRERVRRTGSQPTSGWTLGLAVGGMIAMFIILRMLQLNSNSVGIELFGSIICVALVSPRAHALLFCFHGYGMLLGKRWKAVIRTFGGLTILINGLYYAVITPIAWIFIIPFVLLADKQSTDWVWAAVPTPARRRLRRIWADQSRARAKEEE